MDGPLELDLPFQEGFYHVKLYKILAEKYYFTRKYYFKVVQKVYMPCLQCNNFK
jgi:hypothetical protein